MSVNINMHSQYPKILVISRGVWDDTLGTSSTLSNIFSDYPSEFLSHIYIDPRLPSTKRCSRFFQISEYNLIKRLFLWGTTTGREVKNNEKSVVNTSSDAVKETKILSFVRKHRSHFFNVLREVLWGFNGWKSVELKNYINDVNPDIIWLDGVFDIFLSRLYLHVLKISNKPCVLFLMDDNYSYQSVIGGAYITRFFLRRQINKIVSKCEALFVISPKMKREYDELFGVNSVIITKSIDFDKLSYEESNIGCPVHMVYMGQILYGRLTTIEMIAEQLDRINDKGLKLILHVYTNNYIEYSIKQALSKKGSVVFEEPVPYSQVNSILSQNDVLLFVESLDKKFINLARLSFSTKITDYLGIGKCILAIGPTESASLEYLKDEDAAIVVNDEQYIYKALLQICNKTVVKSYGLKAFECGKRNHDRVLISRRILTALTEIAKNN